MNGMLQMYTEFWLENVTGTAHSENLQVLYMVG